MYFRVCLIVLSQKHLYGRLFACCIFNRRHISNLEELQKLLPKTLDRKREVWHSIKAVKKDNRVVNCDLALLSFDIVPR